MPSYLYSCDKVPELVNRQLEVLDDLVERGGEGLVIHVREDVVDAAVLKQVLLVIGVYVSGQIPVPHLISNFWRVLLHPSL